jgi:hypothetical protein
MKTSPQFENLTDFGKSLAIRLSAGCGGTSLPAFWPQAESLDIASRQYIT